MLTGLQRRLLYFPSREMIAGPGDLGLHHEDLHLTAEDGVTLHAWWLPAPQSEVTVLFLHGNAGNISWWLEAGAVFRGLGWNTMLLDYRGYGLSAGKPSEKGTYLDARAAWRHLVEERGIDPATIVVVGRSLGGGVATWLAGQHPVGGLVLEATFTSIADVVAGMVPLPGIRSVVRLGYPSLSRMPGLTLPLLVAHGRQDELVPFPHGHRLYEAAGGPKRFVELTGGHNDAFALSRESYVAALRAFVREFLGA